MCIRAFLLIVEEFHLLLADHVPGSTISMDGEKKKHKITAKLNNAELSQIGTQVMLQRTENATKWNECLSPAAFALMHHYYFNEDVRRKLKLPMPTDFGKLFSKITTVLHFMMAVKRIQLGPGPIAIHNGKYNRVE